MNGWDVQVLIALLSIIIFILVAHKCWLWSQTRRKMPPGPWSLPVVGGLAIRQLHDPAVRQSWYKRHGSVVTVSTLGRHLVLLSDARILRQAFSQQVMTDSCARSERLKMSLFCMSQERHSRIRPLVKSALHSLGFGQSDIVTVLVTDELSQVFDRMDEWQTTAEIRDYQDQPVSRGEHTRKERSRKELSLEKAPSDHNCLRRKPSLLNMLRCLSVNIIWRMVVGERFDHDSCELNILITGLDTIFANIPIYMKYIQAESLLTLLWPKFSRCRRNVINSLQTLDSMFERCVNECIHNAPDVENLIGECLRMQQHHASDMTDQQIVALLRDCFIGSYESLTNTLLWLLHYVSGDHTWQQRAQYELDTASFPAVWMNKQHFSVCRAILAETHRLSSVAPLGNPHACWQSAEVRGYILPEGTTVLADLYSIHHDAEKWPNPEHFDPGRFLNDGGDFVSNFHLIPFGVGRRRCLGDRLSEEVLFLVFTAVIQRYTFHARSQAGPHETLQPGTAGFTNRPLAEHLFWTKR